MPSLTIILSIVIPVVLLVILFFMSYIKSPPDVATIVSGLKRRIIIGSAGFRIPFFERLDYLNLKLISVDVKTKTSVPTKEYIDINVDSIVNIKISDKPDLLTLASQNFLNKRTDDIMKIAAEVLEGNMREIIGQMQLQEMINDRQKFTLLVKENATPDLAAMGLEIISFNVQNFTDTNEVIKNMGVDNVEQIRKGAQIAKANAQRDVSIAESNARKEANDAEVASQTEIAKKQNELSIKKAELKRSADIEWAVAEAAKGITAEEQRQIKEIKLGDANVAKQQKEIEIQAKAVEIREKALDAEVRKTAEAEKYAVEQKAQADLFQRQRKAEAELFERQKNAEAEQFEAEKQANAKKALAEADKVRGEYEATVIYAKGEAEAKSIQMKLIAEAEGLDKKAEAMKKYGEAATMSMQLDALKVLFNAMPEIAKGIASSYEKVGNIVMYGDQSTKLLNSVMDGTTQLSESLSKSLGIDLKSVLSGVLGGAIGNKITLKKDSEVVKTDTQTSRKK